MKKVLSTLIALLLVAGASAGNLLALDGKKLYTQKTCHTCHGPNGSKPIMPIYPKVSSQNKQYIINQIKDIRSGKRKNGMSMLMKANPLVQKLTDAEIKALADYLSKVK